MRIKKRSFPHKDEKDRKLLKKLIFLGRQPLGFYAFCTRCLRQANIILTQSRGSVKYFDYSATTAVPNLLALILTPGPIVVATTQDLIYWPFIAAGLALTIASIRVLKFS